MPDFRRFTDWVWPTLAPHAPDYFSKLEKRRRTEVAEIRANLARDVERQRRWLEGARKEFLDEEERKKAAAAALHAVFGWISLLTVLLVGLSFWLSQSHAIKPSFVSAVVLAVVAMYPVLQVIGALLAALSGVRVRTYQALPHVAEAIADPMDVAEELVLACLSNGHQTDDRISYKKLAHRFLLNAVLGLIPLALLLVVATLYNTF